jgi:hypothetical protein
MCKEAQKEDEVKGDVAKRRQDYVDQIETSVLLILALKSHSIVQ